jgi:hypothetical protein
MNTTPEELSQSKLKFDFSLLQRLQSSSCQLQYISLKNIFFICKKNQLFEVRYFILCLHKCMKTKSPECTHPMKTLRNVAHIFLHDFKALQIDNVAFLAFKQQNFFCSISFVSLFQAQRLIVRIYKLIPLTV